MTKTYEETDTMKKPPTTEEMLAIAAQGAKEWENDEIGHEGNSPPITAEDELAVDQALGLRSINIRLQEDLIEAFRNMAKTQGIKYQTLMRMALTQYAKAHCREKAGV
jgi:uncharacterized protein (DUF4415 family)